MLRDFVASALCTEVIGIHALFGAFLAGTILPETGGLRHKIGVRLENFSSVLLLPLFFAFTGLRTESEFLQLGALMNTRGLMELIALNIGYDLGILPPRIFTMLVIMALATTVLTGPLLTLFAHKRFAAGRLSAASRP